MSQVTTATTRLVWYLSPLTSPGRRLAGPYSERKDAVRESIKRLSFEAKMSAAANQQMPNLLVPTPARIPAQSVETFSVLSTTNKPANTGNYTTTAKLPDAINKLNQKQLLYLCSALSVDGITENMSKDEIIRILEKELA